MSTKTNFKRIALVAVAALGMGVLSSVPSQAVFSGAAGSQLTLSTTAGTGSQAGSASDSTTAGTLSVSALALNATAPRVESFTVVAVAKSFPAAATSSPALRFLAVDTVGSTAGIPAVTGLVAGEALTTPSANFPQGLADSRTTMVVTATAVGYVAVKFKFFQDSASAQRVAGTYVYTAIVTPFDGINGAGTAQTIDLTITTAATAAQTATASNTILPGSTTVFIGTSTTPTADAAISALATASATPAAYVRVRTFNANGDLKAESITATISGAGVLSYGGITGSSLTGLGDVDGDTNIEVRPNGTAGVGTITITTTSRTFPAKTITFYAAAPATLVASVATPLLAIGSNSDVVRVTAKDSAGVSWAGQLYIYASAAADATIAGAVRATAAADALTCSWDAADDRHECPLSGTAAGTGKFKVTNYATAALATAAASGAEVTSNEVSVVVSQAAVATVKLEFDKASYAPGERARIYVTPLDSAGKPMQAATYANLLATGGISTASALTFAGSTTTADSLTAVAITTKGNSSTASGAKAGSMEYTVYMPVGGGTVTISATGGATLPVAGRVAVTASATVTDSGAAALAAVNALATTVASLRTLITTLTNLVLKIQKKVKA
jgi:hypothetical protein